MINSEPLPHSDGANSPSAIVLIATPLLIQEHSMYLLTKPPIVPVCSLNDL